VVHRDLKPANLFLVALPGQPAALVYRIVHEPPPRASGSRRPTQRGRRAWMGSPRVGAPSVPVLAWQNHCRPGACTANPARIDASSAIGAAGRRRSAGSAAGDMAWIVHLDRAPGSRTWCVIGTCELPVPNPEEREQLSDACAARNGGIGTKQLVRVMVQR
jgi:hypothetical protein